MNAILPCSSETALESTIAMIWTFFGVTKIIPNPKLVTEGSKHREKPTSTTNSQPFLPPDLDLVIRCCQDQTRWYQLVPRKIAPPFL